jgi:subtilisin family serine protease
MAAQRYLVLRTVNGTRGGSSRGIAERLADAEIQADVLPMTARELGDLQRSPATIRTAPVMPVALVAPLASSARADDDRGCAWGIEAVGALRSPFKGHGVTVGVLDTGIDLEHEAFRGTKIEVKDFTGTGDGDLNGHGTHCAGTFFGRDVDGMRIGVAPGIKRALVAKVLNARGHGTTEQIMDGLLWAKARASSRSRSGSISPAWCAISSRTTAWRSSRPLRRHWRPTARTCGSSTPWRIS